MKNKYVYDKRLTKMEKTIDEMKNQNNSLRNQLKLMNQLILKENPHFFEKENYCPICDKFSVFESYGDADRTRAACTNCGSLERHRLAWLILQERCYESLTNKNIKLLHFAPEGAFYNYFKNNKNIDYYPVDFEPERFGNREIRKKVDMQKIPYPNNTFDIIYNCHVLEHVPNDIKGMSELYRVLKKGGTCVTLVPMCRDPETLEKTEYNTPKLRAKYYYNEYHLRKYGLDFKDRLESVGFVVEEIKPKEFVGSELFKLYGLVEENAYICTK